MPGKEQEEQRSVVTLPLKTEIWQADRLAKIFDMCRSVYNTMLGFELKQYRKMLRDQRYTESKKVIDACYQADDKSKRKSAECKDALKLRNELYKEYGFSKYDFYHAVIPFYKHFPENLTCMMARMSVAVPMWAAFEKMIFGNGKIVHFKKLGDWNSIVTDGRSGLRIVDKKGATLAEGTADEPMYLYVGTQKGKKTLMIPVVIPKNDTYKAEMVQRPIRTVRVIRKNVRGTYKYFVQLTVEGAPAPKLDREGNPKHMPGHGKVGVYIDTRTVTAVTEDGSIFAFELNEGIEIYEKERGELLRYMDASRRATNPENYNSDGTIKKGRMVEGQRRPLQWSYSNGYKRAKAKLSNLYRLEKEHRDLERKKLANTLLSLGDDFYINDYPFALAAQRKKEDEFKPNGTPKSKKKAGKVIGENAPSMLVTFLGNKLEGCGKEKPCMIQLKDIDRSPGYRQYYAASFIS